MSRAEAGGINLVVGTASGLETRYVHASEMTQGRPGSDSVTYGERTMRVARTASLAAVLVHSKTTDNVLQFDQGPLRIEFL